MWLSPNAKLIFLVVCHQGSHEKSFGQNLVEWWYESYIEKNVFQNGRRITLSKTFSSLCVLFLNHPESG